MPVVRDAENHLQQIQVHLTSQGALINRMTMSNKVVKILFSVYSELMEQEIVEVMNAETVNADLSHYKMLSIPFYVPLISSGDIVYAPYDDDQGMPKYLETVEPSGNSNIWVVITDDNSDIDNIRTLFSQMDCPSDAVSERFFAMNIKATANYLKVRNKLQELRSEGIIDFSESSLAETHQY